MRAKIDPIQSSFEMVAFGPIFDEQSDFAAHKPFRDKMAGVEKEVARILRDRNYNIIGTHRTNARLDGPTLDSFARELDKIFPPKPGAAT